MKYGAHTFLWIDRWENNHLGLFERARKLGLDVLEVCVGDDVEFDAAELKQASKDSGIDLIISPGGLWPMDADLSLTDPDLAGYAMEWHKHWIDEGAKAGSVAYAGALYGHPGRVIRVAPSHEEFEIICKNLNELANYAEDKGVKIVLEPMSHFRTHIINNPGQALELVNTIDNPNLMLLFDTYHAVTEIRDFYKEIKKLAGKLWAVHACENDRGCPGNGIVPWNDVFRALRDIRFDGYMLLESYNSSIREGAFAYSRGLFHHVCDDGDDFVKKGIDFLKNF